MSPLVGEQQDPIRQIADQRQSDRYPYAGDDPINLTDPTGECFVVSCSTYDTLGRVAITGVNVAYLGASAYLAAGGCVAQPEFCPAIATMTVAADAYVEHRSLSGVLSPQRR